MRPYLLSSVLELRAPAVQYLEIIRTSKGRRESTGRHAGCSPNAIATIYPTRLANPLRGGLLLHHRLRRYLSPASLFCMPPRTFCMPAWRAKGGKVSQAAMVRPRQPDTTAALSCMMLSEGLGDAAGVGEAIQSQMCLLVRPCCLLTADLTNVSICCRQRGRQGHDPDGDRVVCVALFKATIVRPVVRITFSLQRKAMGGTAGDREATQSKASLLVVARRPVRSPATDISAAPVHTLILCAASTLRSHSLSRGLLISVRVPLPPVGVRLHVPGDWWRDVSQAS